jgi:hypothetical protein
MKSDPVTLYDMVEYFEFLDQLRESGDTNMYGAEPYLQEEFDLDREKARDVVLKWMRSYKHDVPAAKRAEGYFQP